jgi:hypothetical protein
MKMKYLTRTLSHAILLVLLFLANGCSGKQDPTAISRNLQVTNLDSSQFPWTPGMADGQTKRWDVERDGLIPVKLNGSQLAQEAIATIETELGMSLFDMLSISDVPDDQIHRGIIVSEGTARGPGGSVDQNTCGNVSASPDTTDYPENFYDSEGRISTRLYVNLSSAKCAASLEIVIHEFGHALGLGNHFSGFGSFTDIISPLFWKTLYTLYHNPIGTPAEKLVIEQTAP